MKFPQLTTKDLNGKTLNLPSDFKGKLNLMLVAYDQWHQREVDTWVRLADELEATIDGFWYYELPVVGRMGMFGRLQLDFWMRTGIPDLETRARTLTLYMDRDEFCRQLEIEHQRNIALLLLNDVGEVVWRGMGAYDVATAESLLQVLQPERV